MKISSLILYLRYKNKFKIIFWGMSLFETAFLNKTIEDNKNYKKIKCSISKKRKI